MRVSQILEKGIYFGFMIVLCFSSAAYADLYANFAVSQNPATPGALIGFSASPSTSSDPRISIVRYDWDFDMPGASASNPNWTLIQSSFQQDAVGVTVSHSYGKFGTYNPVLRITDSSNNVAYAIISINCLLGNENPVSNSGGPYLIYAGDNLQLNGTGSSDPNMMWGDSIVEYLWTIGGKTFSGPNPLLTYAQLTSILGSITPGTQYGINLQVKDSFGLIGMSSTYVSVNPVPIPPALWLLGSGLIGLIGVRRFRK